MRFQSPVSVEPILTRIHMLVLMTPRSQIIDTEISANQSHIRIFLIFDVLFLFVALRPGWEFALSPEIALYKDSLSLLF